ncbi:hypothetical protein D5086_008862 [Populus alba]|uniref:Uncharacterized protein n=1 Tax=Populus alba TaxID=43335 RepID=A0ACC4CI65_POPAL
MRDPVTVNTGQTYDRSSIESWVATGNTTCPVTRAPLTDFTLIPNHTLRRLIQDWCVANRAFGVERIPTPKQPAEPSLVRSLLSQAASESNPTHSRLSALHRLRGLARDSDKDRSLISSHNVREILVNLVFSSSQSLEMSHESLAILVMFPLAEFDCVAIASDPERVSCLANLLFHSSIEVRVNSAALIENVIAGTRSSDLRLQIKRALATIELLSRIQVGCAAFVAHALTVPLLVKTILKISDRATEYAAGALLVLCSASEQSQKEAVCAGILTQLLLLVQSDCTDRAKRKAQMLLKLLRDSWPEDSAGNSDDFVCSEVVPF